MAPSNPLQSTIFRLAFAAVVLLGLLALVIAWTVGSSANRVLTQVAEEAIQADIARFRSEYAARGIEGLAVAIEEKSRHPAGGLYLLVDATGRWRAGNLAVLPDAIKGSPRAGIFTYEAAEAAAQQTAAGILVDLDGGATVLIARDVESQRSLLASIYRSLALGLGVLTLVGIGGGFCLARHTLARIDGMRQASATIMAGDLAGRLPISGSGDELDRLGMQLNVMIERIGRLMAGLREVSDNIAHDLKTPLNRLRNSAEAALSDTRGSAAWREGLERTIEEADDLIKTFNALLLIARLEAGAVEESFEYLDLVPLLGDVVELYEPVAEETGLRIAIAASERVPVRVNRQLVGQALANLIDNAIKYSSPRVVDGRSDARLSTIDVSATCVDGKAVLSVGDHGPGISAGDRERVLKRFVRLESSRTRAGSGLGLSLVAAVAQLHQGTVRLEDNHPGLCVVVTLPLAQVGEPVASSSHAPAAAPAGRP